MKEILRLIGIVVAVIGAVTGAAIYVIKQLIEKFLASKLEAYKHSLKLSFMEHEVRFKRLDEKRAEIVAHLFGLLVTVQNAAYVYLTEDTRFPKDREKDLNDALFAFGTYLQVHQIYLEEDLCNLLSTFHSNVLGPTSMYSFIRDLYVGKPGEEEHQELQQSRKQYFEEFTAKVTVIRAALEKEFRTILGVIKEERAGE